MKKSFGLLLALMISITMLLAACGGNDTEDAKGGKNGDKTISVWAMGEEGKKLDELTKKFEEENPGIKVKVQAIPWDTAHDKLLTAVASGKGPDVLQLGTTWVPEFADAGALLDLTPYLEDYPQFKPENYFEGAQTSMHFGDQIVGVPWYVETRLIYYRTDLLEEVGYPNGPATWDELKDAAEKLTARGEGFYGLDIDQADQVTPFIFAWQNGFEFDTEKPNLNLDSPEFEGAMEYLTSYFKEGLSPTTKGMDIIQAFKDGVKPMFFSGPWMINIINDQAPDLDGKWSVAVMPKKETNTSSIGGANFTVFHNSKNVDEALKYIQYVTDVDTQLEWLEISNTLPSRVEAWEDPVLAENEMLSTFGEQLKNTTGSPQITQFEKVAQELIATLEKVNVGGADLSKELDKFRTEVEKIMQD
ncbi:sugar ABC transporter substrate-binding protein [Bacillus sp. REN16]|uniref:sugar ABC transporter substrate-binding protein n=1 Tax=Bacillus sp. REN16 TaxID=2887296 RepID=UPI001E3581F7|nr:sugar ABC transporter substrate-binding protein [Bacillus sp. REN16]MCC3358492.1 sugar ABC transporter substrate-binding protein [Bacillus sp. REN16]